MLWTNVKTYQESLEAQMLRLPAHLNRSDGRNLTTRLNTNELLKTTKKQATSFTETVLRALPTITTAMHVLHLKAGSLT